jgi:L-lactate dehydrogenase
VRICVWGAGNIGTNVAYRLAAEECVSEIHWVNRSYDEMLHRVIDLEHGLAFAPSCHTVEAYEEADAAHALENADIVILTHGKTVAPGQDRKDIWKQNAELFREKAIPALKGYPGFVLVVTNPVDSLTRLMFEETGITDATRAFGLGTIVDSARLRSAVGRYSTPVRNPRAVRSFCLGTHDDLVIAMAAGEDISESTLELARGEVVEGAKRVKFVDEDGETTVTSRSPIAEGTVLLLRAIANDARTILTPSIREATDGHFYSWPCIVGARGIEKILPTVVPGDKLAACKTRLSKMWGEIAHA